MNLISDKNFSDKIFSAENFSAKLISSKFGQSSPKKQQIQIYLTIMDNNVDFKVFSKPYQDLITSLILTEVCP
jgi:hypothetical protein